jgi:hypothetical protein
MRPTCQSALNFGSDSLLMVMFTRHQ